jgi:hypothetical protein
VDVDRESTPPSRAVGFGLVGVDSAQESTPFPQSVVEWPVVADPTRGSARRPWPRLLRSGRYGVDALGESTPSIQPLVVRPEGVDTVWNSIAEPTPSIQDACGFRPEGVNAEGASTPLSLAAVARRDEHGSPGVTCERTRVEWVSRDRAAKCGRPRDRHPLTELVLPDGTAATEATRMGDPGGGTVLGVLSHGFLYFLTRRLRASERELLGVTPAHGWRACVLGSFTRQ